MITLVFLIYVFLDIEKHFFVYYWFVNDLDPDDFIWVSLDFFLVALPAIGFYGFFIIPFLSVCPVADVNLISQQVRDCPVLYPCQAFKLAVICYAFIMEEPEKVLNFVDFLSIIEFPFSPVIPNP